MSRRTWCLSLLALHHISSFHDPLGICSLGYSDSVIGVILLHAKEVTTRTKIGDGKKLLEGFFSVPYTVKTTNKQNISYIDNNMYFFDGCLLGKRKKSWVQIYQNLVPAQLLQNTRNIALVPDENRIKILQA